MRVERRPCQICGTVTQSIGYKAFVCGACSIFYRRNFRNRDQIKCRQNGHCDLTAGSGHRNQCRACRMKMCRELGLRMVGNSLVIQSNGFPLDDIEDETLVNGNSTVSALRSTPSTSVPPFNNQQNTSQQNTSQQQNINYFHQIKTEPMHQSFSDLLAPTIIIAGSTSISATNLPGCSKIVPVIHTTSAHLTTPTTSYTRSSSSSRQFDQIFPSPTNSEPRSSQSIHLPSTPLMNVFDPAPNLYNSSESAMVDDILVGAVVNLKPAYQNGGISVPLPSFSSLTADNASEFPIMCKTVRAFARFEERQRCLASIMKGSDVQVDREYVDITMHVYSIMENRTLRLACITIAELLHECHDLNVQERAAILKSTILEISSFYKYSLTSRVFPVINDQRMALFAGCCCRLDDIAGFMGADYEKTKHVMEPLWGVGRIGISRFRYLEPTFDESAVLLSILVLENVERLGIMKQHAIKQREQLYKEFGYYLAMHHGFDAASVRIIRLMTLLCDVKMYTTAYEDTYSLLGIFLPEDRDAFWCNKPHVSDTQLAKLAFAPSDMNPLG